ncbi:MAG TPA: alpha/beta hydrolase [Candidatus Dormibacteraeota bacterium]|nr:alpha/beta hydrolase [Candidatus Dormibacteraeota bacterium]
MAGKCGYLTVPENRADPKGRNIDIYVVIMPAIDPAKPAEPVFFIAGGPGSSTVHDWAEAPLVFAGMNDHHDIVLVDQRGTGSSHPLVLPPLNPGESPTDYKARALAEIDGDPRYYTTAVAMDDLDAVRQALHYDKIDLYGGSYGATAVQYYLRQHGDRVHAAVMDGGTLVEVPIFELFAPNSQRALDAVLGRCLADTTCASAYPEVRAEFASVMSGLSRRPVATTIMDPSGEPIVVTSDVFAVTIHQLLVGSESGKIPWLIHQASSGNLTAVAVELSRYLGGGATTLVMSLEILCSEGWARNDPEQVKVKGEGSYLLSSQIAFAEMYAGACRDAPPGYVRADDAQPVRTNVPVLILNGSDDPQDPPANVAAAAQEMPNSLLVIAPGQGHTVGHIACLPIVVTTFFDQGKARAMAAANACTATMAPPAFVLG